MQSMKITLLVFAFACLSLQATGQVTGWLQGTWTGTGDQRSAGKGTWTMKLTYDPANSLAEVDYPSLICKGGWKLVESTAAKAVFTEILSSGRTNQNCKDDYSIVVTKVSPTSVKVAYFKPGDNVNDASKTVTSLTLTKS